MTSSTASRVAAGVRIANISDRTFLMHLGGKIEIRSKVPIRTPRRSLAWPTRPGVARVCLAINDDPSQAFTLTIKQNTVAVVTDGTAVLGLGDIGPEAALPVMEGKAMLFKEFAGVDAFPICLDTKDPRRDRARRSSMIAPAFGGINLEDISAPRCFEVEERLRKELDIPVFHDDQHGTAVVVLAALLNALKIVGKEIARRQGGGLRRGRGRDGRRSRSCWRWASARSSACDEHGTLYRGRRARMDSDEDLGRRGHQPRGPQGPPGRRHRRARTCSSACRARGS